MSSIHSQAGVRAQYLDAMGIQKWELRAKNVEPLVDAAAEPAICDVSNYVSSDVSSDVSNNDWSTLRNKVSFCTLCELHSSRTQTVFGVGAEDADWLIIGEAPNQDEDKQGEPFVDKSGQLLTQMLRAIGLRREQVYIANILKCRPPSDRDPKVGEVVCCEPYLYQQIALLQPKIILAVGRIAAQHLLKVDTPIGKLRGIVHTFGETSIPLIATYHPAYLLRSPVEKRKSWQDLQLALGTLSNR